MTTLETILWAVATIMLLLWVLPQVSLRLLRWRTLRLHNECLWEIQESFLQTARSLAILRKAEKEETLNPLLRRMLEESTQTLETSGQTLVMSARKAEQSLEEINRLLSLFGVSAKYPMATCSTLQTTLTAGELLDCNSGTRMASGLSGSPSDETGPATSGEQ